MSHVIREVVSVTTSSDGSATAYTNVVTGRIHSIAYVKNNFSNGVDFTITLEATGQTVWTQLDVNASATVLPRAAVHDTAGVASLYASGGEPVEDCICAANDRVKIVIASGGSVTSGTFHVILN